MFKSLLYFASMVFIFQHQYNVVYSVGLSLDNRISSSQIIENELNTRVSYDVSGLKEGTFATVYSEKYDETEFKYNSFFEFRQFGIQLNGVPKQIDGLPNYSVLSLDSCQINDQYFVSVFHYINTQVPERHEIVSVVQTFDGLKEAEKIIKVLNKSDGYIYGPQCSQLKGTEYGISWYQSTGDDGEDGIYMDVLKIGEVAQIEDDIAVAGSLVKDYPNIKKITSNKALVVYVRDLLIEHKETGQSYGVYFVEIDLTTKIVSDPILVKNGYGTDLDTIQNLQIKEIKYEDTSDDGQALFLISWRSDDQYRFVTYDSSNDPQCTFFGNEPREDIRSFDISILKGKAYLVASSLSQLANLSKFQHRIIGVVFDLNTFDTEIVEGVETKTCREESRHEIEGFQKENRAFTVKSALSKGDESCSILLGINYVQPTNPDLPLDQYEDDNAVTQYNLKQLQYVVYTNGNSIPVRCLFGCSAAKCYACKGSDLENKQKRDTDQLCVCTDGYYDTQALIDAEDFDCLPCDLKCAKCIDSTPDKCDGCNGLNRKASPSCDCLDNYYFNSDEHESDCQKCMDQCSECSDGESCTKCVDEFLLDPTTSGDNSCTVCIDGYGKYKGKCIECKTEDNRIIDDLGMCICTDKFFLEEDGGENFTCDGCLDQCSTCLDNSSCKSCENEHMLLAECTNCDNVNGWYAYTDTCVTCLPENNQIVDADTQNCICESNFFMKDQDGESFTCEACISGCEVCPDDTSCTKCQNGLQDPTNDCKSCTDGDYVYPECFCTGNQYRDGETCVDCDPMCDKCTGGALGCNECVGANRDKDDNCNCPAEGYKPNNDTTKISDCEKCPEDNCIKCDGDDSDCSEWELSCPIPGRTLPFCLPITIPDIPCTPGQFLLGLGTGLSECAPCLPTCATCTDKITCQTCDNLISETVKCLEKEKIYNVITCNCGDEDNGDVCPYYCADCVEDEKTGAMVCKSCQDPTLQAPQCVCKLGEFWDTSIRACTSCHDGCSSCTGGNKDCINKEVITDGGDKINVEQNNNQDKKDESTPFWLILLIAGLCLMLLVCILLAVYLKKRKERNKVFNRFGQGQHVEGEDDQNNQNGQQTNGANNEKDGNVNTFMMNSLDTMNQQDRNPTKINKKNSNGGPDGALAAAVIGDGGVASGGRNEVDVKKMILMANRDLQKKEDDEKKMYYDEEEENYYQDSAYQQSYEQLQQIKKQEQSSTVRTGINLPYGHDQKLKQKIKESGVNQKKNWNQDNQSENNNLDLSNNLDNTDKNLLVSGMENQSQISGGFNSNSAFHDNFNNSIQTANGKNNKNSGSKKGTFNNTSGSNMFLGSQSNLNPNNANNNSNLDPGNQSNGFDIKSSNSNNNKNLTLEEKKKLRKQQKESSQQQDIQNYQQKQNNLNSSQQNFNNINSSRGNNNINGSGIGSSQNLNSNMSNNNNLIGSIGEDNNNINNNNNNNAAGAGSTMSMFGASQTSQMNNINNDNNEHDQFGSNLKNDQNPKGEMDFENNENINNQSPLSLHDLNGEDNDNINQDQLQNDDYDLNQLNENQQNSDNLENGLQEEQNFNQNNEQGQNEKDKINNSAKKIADRNKKSRISNDQYQVPEDEDPTLYMHQHNKRSRNYNKGNKVWNQSDKDLEDKVKKDMEGSQFNFVPFVRKTNSILKNTQENDDDNDNNNNEDNKNNEEQNDNNNNQNNLSNSNKKPPLPPSSSSIQTDKVKDILNENSGQEESEEAKKQARKERQRLRQEKKKLKQMQQQDFLDVNNDNVNNNEQNEELQQQNMFLNSDVINDDDNNNNDNNNDEQDPGNLFQDFEPSMQNQQNQSIQQNQDSNLDIKNTVDFEKEKQIKEEELKNQEILDKQKQQNEDLKLIDELDFL